jgi:hypothetical protein
MIQRLIFRLFGFEDAPEYKNVRTLSVPRPIPEPTSSDAQEILEYLRKKHMVSGISIFTEEGALVATTYSEDDALHEYSVFEQISYELANATHFYVQSDDEWIIAFRHHNHIYVIHAPAYLNMVELAAIARDAEKLLFSMGW